jgi:hypothetical protein
MDGRIPFQVAIVTLVVGLLAVTCGALITYGLHSNQRNVEILKRDYLDQVAQATLREVARLPRTATQVLNVERHRFQSGQYATGDALAVAGALAGALRADPDMQWVSYGEASGRFMGARRLGPEEIVLNISEPRRNRGVPSEFRAGTLARYVQTPPLDQPYDPRTRGWYQRALAAADTVVWMPPYEFAEGATGVTAAAAVRDSAQRVQGVVTVDFTLAGIARFLETVEIAHGAVVLFDDQGKLLGGAPGPGRDAAVLAMRDGRSEAIVAGEKWEVTKRSLAPQGAGPGPLQVLVDSLVVDGKVVELEERDGVRSALVRFTGVDWDTQARLDALARVGAG